MKKLALTFCALALVAFAACSGGDDDNPANPTLSVDIATLTFDAAGGEKTFNITSAGDWTVSGQSAAAWLKVEPAAGAGNQSVTLAADPNTGTEERSVELTVTATGAVPVKVMVKQSGTDTPTSEKLVKRMILTSEGEERNGTFTLECFYDEQNRVKMMKGIGRYAGGTKDYIEQYEFSYSGNTIVEKCMITGVSSGTTTVTLNSDGYVQSGSDVSTEIEGGGSNNYAITWSNTYNNGYLKSNTKKETYNSGNSSYTTACTWTDGNMTASKTDGGSGLHAFTTQYTTYSNKANLDFNYFFYNSEISAHEFGILGFNGKRSKNHISKVISHKNSGDYELPFQYKFDNEGYVTEIKTRTPTFSQSDGSDEVIVGYTDETYTIEYTR